LPTPPLAAIQLSAETVVPPETSRQPWRLARPVWLPSARLGGVGRASTAENRRRFGWYRGWTGSL